MQVEPMSGVFFKDSDKFVERFGKRPKFSCGHSIRVPAGGKQFYFGKIFEPGNSDESILFPAKLEQPLLRQWGTLPTNPVRKDEQTAIVVSEQGLPTLHGDQVVPGRPMLPIRGTCCSPGKLSPFNINEPREAAGDGDNEIKAFERFPIVKQISLPLVDTYVRNPILTQIRLERRFVVVVEEHFKNEK